MIQWKYIMDSQPVVGKWVIEAFPPSFDETWSFSMKKYIEFCPFKELLDYRRRGEHPDPDYWWIYIEDYPFPKQNNQKKSRELSGSV